MLARPSVLRWSLLVSLFALCACRPRAAETSAPSTIDAATLELARCAFDGDPPALAPLFSDRSSSALEGLVRRAVHRDRYAFSVRAGRCASALSPALRERDPRARELFDAWEGLLPLAQSPQRNEIDLDRAVRRLGLAWRAARSPR
jgi:hypothetical protein